MPTLLAIGKQRHQNFITLSCLSSFTDVSDQLATCFGTYVYLYTYSPHKSLVIDALSMYSQIFPMECWPAMWHHHLRYAKVRRDAMTFTVNMYSVLASIACPKSQPFLLTRAQFVVRHDIPRIFQLPLMRAPIRYEIPRSHVAHPNTC